jgi:Pyruvate/2-oxoacid:ferredoxin oxidoreductase gamma subunit
MPLDKDEFKFPDEGGKDELQADEFQIEVEDDTPPEDRNRRPMNEAPKDFADDELAKYDEGVRKRIQHFTKGYHEERRAKETALREKEEAIRAAQAIVEENKKLKGSLSQGQQALLEQAKRVVATEVETAKKKYKDAYEAGDSDALVAAQEELTTAKMKAERVNNFKPTPLQQETPAVQIDQNVTAPQPDSRAQEWQRDNKWFGKDEEMTGFALALHNKLIRTGIDPTSDEYYDRVNSRMRQVFPEAFEDSDRQANASSSPRRSNVVAPASRSTAPKKIVLTKSQVEIAKRLGVPLELYARKVAEEMRK